MEQNISKRNIHVTWLGYITPTTVLSHWKLLHIITELPHSTKVNCLVYEYKPQMWTVCDCKLRNEKQQNCSKNDDELDSLEFFPTIRTWFVKSQIPTLN